MQIHDLEMEVSDMRGKFIIPKLKRLQNTIRKRSKCCNNNSNNRNMKNIVIYLHANMCAICWLKKEKYYLLNITSFLVYENTSSGLKFLPKSFFFKLQGYLRSIMC